MKVRRIVTAESKSGVAVQAIDLPETTAAGLPTNIWGFDQLPTLPLATEQVLGDYLQKGLFGPKGALRVDVMSFPPEVGNQPPDLEALMTNVDFGTGHNMTPGKLGNGMHRTDSIDLVVVISGEGDMSYPDEDGELKEVRLKVGDSWCKMAPFMRGTTVPTHPSWFYSSRLGPNAKRPKCLCQTKKETEWLNRNSRTFPC